MIAPDEVRAFRRIVLAIDATTDGTLVLDAAAALAARLRAELAAVFVEDLDLLNSADLPFVLQTSLFTAASQVFDMSATERELRTLAGQLRRRLAAEAERQHFAWSFRVVRCRACEAFLEAGESDLLVLGGSGRALLRHLRPGPGGGAAVARRQGSVLLFNPSRRLAGPVVVVQDRAGMARALAVGAWLAEARGEELVVLVVAAADAEAQALEEEARAWLDRRGLEAELHRTRSADAQGLCDAITRCLGGRRSATTIVDADSPLLEDPALLAAMDRAGYDLLMAR